MRWSAVCTRLGVAEVVSKGFMFPIEFAIDEWLRHFRARKADWLVDNGRFLSSTSNIRPQLWLPSQLNSALIDSSAGVAWWNCWTEPIELIAKPESKALRQNGRESSAPPKTTLLVCNSNTFLVQGSHHRKPQWILC